MISLKAVKVNLCFHKKLFTYKSHWELEFEVFWIVRTSQPAITCSKLTKETLEQGVKYIPHLVLVFLLLTLSR